MWFSLCDAFLALPQYVSESVAAALWITRAWHKRVIKGILRMAHCIIGHDEKKWLNTVHSMTVFEVVFFFFDAMSSVSIERV